MSDTLCDRRSILRLSIAATGLLVPAGVEAQARGATEQSAGAAEVSPPEDLMREHGVLKRVLLVYREVIRRVNGGEAVAPEVVRDSAAIIRQFIEEYHEQLEEQYLFPRFERAHRLVELTGVLRRQHQAGRRLTDQIAHLATAPALEDRSSSRTLASAMEQFIRMYEPHEAREDTVLFPAIRAVVSPHEFGALGEEFEKQEQQRFGDDGFERIVDRVAGVEKTLGIYDLAQFTPAT